MGYCVASGGNLWVIVWQDVIICMGYCVASDGNLWVIFCRVVVICYGLFSVEWW